MLAMVIHADAVPSPQSASGLNYRDASSTNTMQRTGAIWLNDIKQVCPFLSNGYSHLGKRELLEVTGIAVELANALR